VEHYRPKLERMATNKREERKPRPPAEDDLDEELRKALELSKQTAMKEEAARLKEA
jgi:hypothetical protein